MMECNRDEANRELLLSESKLLEEKDFVVAQRYAEKARSLWPEVKGLKLNKRLPLSISTSVLVERSTEKKLETCMACLVSTR